MVAYPRRAPLQPVLLYPLVAECPPHQAVAAPLHILDLHNTCTNKGSSVDCCHLSTELRGSWVAPQLHHGPRLAQAVGRLAAVVGEVLLTHPANHYITVFNHVTIDYDNHLATVRECR